MENPIKMDDLGVRVFLETPMLNFGGVDGDGFGWIFDAPKQQFLPLDWRMFLITTP